MESLTDADGMIDAGRVLAASVGLITAAFFENLADLVDTIMYVFFILPVEIFTQQSVAWHEMGAMMVQQTFAATVAETQAMLGNFGPFAFLIALAFVVVMAWLMSKAVMLYE